MAGDRSTIEFAANDSALQQSLRNIAANQKLIIKGFQDSGKSAKKFGEAVERAGRRGKNP